MTNSRNNRLASPRIAFSIALTTSTVFFIVPAPAP